MTSHPPEVPIEVDNRTGVWTTDGLPMLYVPRHFFINNHVAIEASLGAEKYAEVLYQAGYKSAWYWCEKESKQHDISGDAVFHHYMKRLSQRGWGLFTTEMLEIEEGRAQVRLDHSAFVYQMGQVGRKVDYMYTGWFSGALDQISEANGYAVRTVAHQTQCAAELGMDFGLFEVEPIT